MSKGDMLIGKKTFYKGIEMRSIFETKIAFFLDILKIKWEYEPKRFRLSNGMYYVPDFYLPELKMWIEGKGKIEEHNKEISKQFVKDSNQHLILMSVEEGYYYGNEYGDENGKEVYEDDEILIGLCYNCKRYYFSSGYGLYACKKCGCGDGDHVFHHPHSEFKREWKKVYGSI